MGQETVSMLKVYALLVVSCIIICQAGASPYLSADEEMSLEGPNNIWVKTYDYSFDRGHPIDISLTDSGYIIGGTCTGNRYDGLLLHLYLDGTVIFQRQLGGADYDLVSSVAQCVNGDFVMVGHTRSFVPNATAPGNLWLARLAKNGTVLWNYGYPDLYYGSSVVECQDGSFIIAAAQPHLNHISSNGLFIWSRSYGNWDISEARSVVECDDGGFAFTGLADTDPTSEIGYQAWLMRTDSNGTMLWNQTYGDAPLNIGRSLIRCSDGGFAIVGESGSWYYFPRSPWLIRTDENGNMLWNRMYSTGYAYSVVECSDGGFGIAGTAAASGEESTWGALFVRTDEDGNELWGSVCSGPYEDNAHSLVLSDALGFTVFAVAGSTRQSDSWNAFLWCLSDEHVPPTTTTTTTADGLLGPAIPILVLGSGIMFTAAIIWKLSRHDSDIELQ